MSGYDPGGGQQPPPVSGSSSTPDLTMLQENFTQQQAKITALREMVRQTESAQGKKTASAQERVKNIAQRLTQYKTKATRSRLSRAGSSEVPSSELMGSRIQEEDSGQDASFNISGVDYEEQQHMSLPVMPVTGRARSETPGTEKINLLRQQMEQNRLKMAERESHKREMEERVIELKHKLESTQQTLERSVELGRSTGDLTLLTPFKMGRFEFNKSTSDLTQLVGTSLGGVSNFDVERLNYLEGRVKVLEKDLANKENISTKDETVQQLERKIADLEEALKEKECLIEARTQAVSSMTEHLTMKGKNTVDLLEDTKQEMFKMQSNFVQAESSMKDEIDRLQLELNEKNSKVSNLEEMNNILETARYDLTVENASLKQKLEDVQDFSTKIGELNKLNQSLQHRITELENQKYEFITDAEAEQAKFGENDEKYRELLDRIQELEEDLSKKNIPENDLLEKIRSLEATIEAQKEQIESFQQQHAELQENLQEKTVELNVLNANFSVLQEKLKNAGPKPLFPKSAEEEAEVETSKLKQQLDEANKSMIKSKLKIKQLQKQVDSFKKTSGVHEEVVRLTEEVQSLHQRLAEVEEEKGNLQLHLVNYDGSLPDSELEKRIKILETTCHNQTTAIQLLEEQKLDICEDLSSTKQELESMRDHVKEMDQSEQSGSISCQMSSIEFEEKLERCLADKETISAQLQRLEEEKSELQQKLDRYMVENMELLEKIEKLSLEKVSSAESIEIVEGLTAKEKQEIECYELGRAKTSTSTDGEEKDSGEDEADRLHRQEMLPQSSSLAEHCSEMDDDKADRDDEDLNSSLVKLREESSELMHKIELFTAERREVLDKLEALTVENQRYSVELEELRAERQTMLEKYSASEEIEAKLKSDLTKAEGERDHLLKELEAAQVLKDKLESDVVSGASSSHSSPAKTSGGPTIDRDSFEQALRSVDNEVNNYNKNKDKNKKLQISKKLSSDAKNLQKLASELLIEYFNRLEQFESMAAEIETLKLKVADESTAAKPNPEIDVLKAQIMEMTHAQIEKVECIDELKQELCDRRDELEELRRELEAAREAAEKSSDDEPELLKVELNSRNDEIRELKKELEALGLRKANEVDDIQTKLHAASKEIEILKELVAEQKQQLIDTYQEHEHEITAKLKEIQDYENQTRKMKAELDELNARANESAEKYSENMNNQLDKLQSIVDDQNKEIAHKQETIETLNSQIIELYKTMEENANKIIEKDDEVQYLQEMLDSKKDEIDMLHQKLATGQKSMEELQHQLNAALAQPIPPPDETRIKHLEQQNKDLEDKNREQLEKLKKFAANIKKRTAHCQELEEKITGYQNEIEALKQAQATVVTSNESFDDLKEENEQLSQKLHHLNNELHKLLQQKYTLESEKQTIQHTVDSLLEKAKLNEAKISEQEEQLQKLEATLEGQAKELHSTQEESNSRNVKIEKCKAIIKEKNKEIQRLQEHERKTAYLEDELKMSQSKFEDFHNQTLLLGRLKGEKEEMNVTLKTEVEKGKQTQLELNQASEKTRKLEVDLDIAEEENRNLKEKILKLEKGISLVEERRNSLERQKKLLGQTLEEKTQEFTQHEDELMQRLVNLSQHDEVIERKLKEKEDELMDIESKLRHAEDERDQLQLKIGRLEELLKAGEEASKRAAELENDNYGLSQQVSALQIELRQAAAESSANLAEKDSEMDQLEVELSNQLTKIENERKQLQEQLERSRDSNTDLQDEVVRLQESVNSLEQMRSDLDKEVTWLKMQNESLGQDSNELQELRMQIVQDQTELENLRGQCETLAHNHQCEVNALRQQIADMEAIRTQLSQNQTDDQVYVQNEMIKLRDLLEQKESEVVQLQQRNLQLQMTANSLDLTDPFSSLQSNLSQSSVAAYQEKISDLEKDGLLKDSRIQEIQIERDLLTENCEQLKRQIQLLQANLEKTEALETALLQKSAELQNASQQFSKVSHPQSVATFSPAQFFGAEQSTSISLFDASPTTESFGGQGWEEPILTQQIQDPLSAIAQTNPTGDDELEQLKLKHQEALKEIEELRSKIQAMTDRDDEFHQLRDEIEIIRSQNASLIYELEEKNTKLKDVAVKLQEEQLKSSQLEEKLVPSVASFFTSGADAGAAVFEEIVVPKKAYLCTPSASEDHDQESGQAVEEHMFSSAVTSTHHAAPFRVDDGTATGESHELKLQNELQSKQIEELTAMAEQLKQDLKMATEHNKELEILRKSEMELRNQYQSRETLIAELEQQIQQLQLEHNQATFALQQKLGLQQTELKEMEEQKQHEMEGLHNEHRKQLNLFEDLSQQHMQLKAMLEQKQNEIVSLQNEHHEQQKQLEDNLRQQGEQLEQNRDAMLQLTDEIDILKAQNSSLLQEMDEKSDKIKRLCQTLTEKETKLADLEEKMNENQQQQSLKTVSSFFDAPPQQGQQEAVFEDIIQPKKAFELRLDEEDCWGGEEALLEEKHQQTSSTVLERRISEKDDYIRQLEMEKERLQQDITDLKVKSGKLLKKVKEYKAKSENLERRSASMETNELDLAIQEELNTQIKSLEGKLAELQAEREKDGVEKDSLLKRIDVLTAANDRFTEMKDRQDQQIEIQLAKIKELNRKIEQLEDWGDDSGHKTPKPSETLSTSASADTGRVAELERELQDLRVDHEELQALLDEEKANVEILEKRVQQKDAEIRDLIEKIDILSQDSRTIKSSLETLNQQKSQETIQLSEQLRDLMAKNSDLTDQIERMRNESIFHSSEEENKLQEQLQQLSAQVQYKEAEIVHLNERIQQQIAEDQTESLVQEILVKNQEIGSLKARVLQLESDQQELQSNLTLQITKELAVGRPEDKQTSTRIAELERSNKDLMEEKLQMEQELQVLNDQVLRSLEFEDRMKNTVFELDAKNIEIEALKSSLESIKQQSGGAISGDADELRRQLQQHAKERADLEANYRITLEQRDAHWSHVVEERGAQVAESWKQHVDSIEAEFSIIEKSLREEIARLNDETKSEAPSDNERPTPMAVDSAMVQSMKEALENQELEIVTLKEQLAIRSAEYARLAAQVDPFAVRHASNMVTSEPRSLTTVSTNPPVDNGDKVPRSELELALYMIYQRDMRCEELELELRNLLEERDALQLRLSNALRQQEEFKRKLTTNIAEVSGDSSDISKTTTPEKSLQQIVQESGITASNVAAEVPEELTTKLSELHSIGHAKDKRLQEEREERHRQLTLIQRDLANMPLEAAAKITGANVATPTDTAQQQPSASSVLINWILGKKSDT
ncbi:protein lava lamp [Uranotaenia lowii]|uniref:protein lava lamp n=1 Tax=Uranotaenia lowii TaxID=190385 RepID=UPI002478C9C7|nr:protein lava lamp [Uranotaenia lowii]